MINIKIGQPCNNHFLSDPLMDRISPEKRSWNMSRVRSTDTKPELKVRSFLFRQGFRFRLHVKTLPGHPDIVLPKYKTVIEVRGCFWHRHPGCKIATTPSSNIEFWQEKFRKNVERDAMHADELKRLGWNLIVVWGCETTKKTFPPASLRDFVNSNHRNTTVNEEWNGVLQTKENSMERMND